MLDCWISPITAVTGSCQTSVTAASSTSSRPETIRTEETSRMSRLSGRPAILPGATAGALEHARPHLRIVDLVASSDPGPA